MMKEDAWAALTPLRPCRRSESRRGCCGPDMSSPSSCKCLHCREFFVPCSNNRRTQRYCPKAECRKASKIAAQAKWLNKPQNRCYFRGPENVERVRRWREHHPGYWRKKRPPADALQDLALIKLSQSQPVTLNKVGLVAGDFILCGPSTPPSAGSSGSLSNCTTSFHTSSSR